MVVRSGTTASALSINTYTRAVCSEVVAVCSRRGKLYVWSRQKESNFLEKDVLHRLNFTANQPLVWLSKAICPQLCTNNVYCKRRKLPNCHGRLCFRRWINVFWQLFCCVDVRPSHHILDPNARVTHSTTQQHKQRTLSTSIISFCAKQPMLLLHHGGEERRESPRWAGG